MHCAQSLLLNAVLVLCSMALFSPTWALPTKQRFCGTNLADALKLACDSRGYNPPDWTSDYRVSESLVQKQYYVHGLGVATECCYFGCTRRTLMSYCADSKPKAAKKGTEQDDSYDTQDIRALASEERVAKESDVVAFAPAEVGQVSRKPARMGGQGKRGNRKRKGGKGRKKVHRRRGGRVPRCRCDSLNKRPKKIDVENIRRMAPVFGTVSPEYFRQPRTLDELPPSLYGIQGY